MEAQILSLTSFSLFCTLPNENKFSGSGCQTTARAPLGGIELHCGCVAGTHPSCSCNRDTNGSDSPLKLPFTSINPLWTQVAAGGLGQGLRCIGGSGTLGEAGQELSDWKIAELEKLLVFSRAGNPSVSDTQQCPISGCTATDQAVVRCHFVTCWEVWSLRRVI